MRKHYIPPNFDSSRLTLFGFLRVSALLESILLLLPFYYAYLQIKRYVELSYIVEMILIIIGLTLLILLTALNTTESLVEKGVKYFLFTKNKRILTFRRPMKRIRIRKDEEKDKQGQGFLEVGTLKKRLFQILTRSNPRKLRQIYSQELIDVKDIHDQTGIVILRNDRYVKILEIRPTNFFSLSEVEQEAILIDFAQFLKVSPEYFQFKIVSEKADMSNYIAELRDCTKEEDILAIHQLREELIEKIQDLSDTTVLNHRHFLIFSVSSSEGTEEKKLTNAYNRLKVLEDIARSKLSRRGVEILFDIDLEQEIKLNRHFGQFLFDFYNKKVNERSTLENRVHRVREDIERYRVVDKDNSISVSNFLAPISVDLRKADHILVNGVYISYCVLTKYPSRGFYTGFFSKFSNLGAGFDFDLIVQRVPKYEILSKLKKRNILTKTNADQMRSFSGKLFETKKIIASTDYMVQALEGDEEFFYILPVITLSAMTYKELESKKIWLKNLIESYNLGVKIPKYEMERFMKLTEPLSNQDDMIFRKYRRNLLTDGLVGFYPLTMTSLSQDNGILLGVDLVNRTPVILDNFDPVSNMMVFGTTGYGKSFLCMLIASRMRMMQNQVYILSPIKGHEYRQLTGRLGGSFIEIGPGSKDCINILEIRPILKIDETDLSERDIVNECSYLNEKIQELLSFFDLITDGKLTNTQKDLLSPFLVNFYRTFGITEENMSIYLNEDHDSDLKTMPILSDLEKQLEDDENIDLRELAIPLKKFTKGNLSYLNNQTNIDLENKFCCIDINRALDYADTRNLVLFIVMNHLWTRIRSNRTKRKVIIFEEIWKMLQNKETAQTVKEMYKTIRGYYGSVIGITQNLGDLTENPFDVGDGILNNTLIQCFLHNSPKEVEKLKEYFKLSINEYSEITGAEKGEAFLITPGYRRMIKIEATETEKYLFETDGNKLS